MSALLNVNVDSTSGRAEVLAFKKFVQDNLSAIKFDVKVDNLPTLKMQIDQAALNSSLTAVLGEIHQVGIDSGSIVKNVQEALRTAFSREYEVKIASAHLTEQVSAAIKAGMTLGEVNVAGARTNLGVAGSGVTPSMLAEAVRSGIAPLADKIDMQTKSTENSMRAGRRTASISTSGRSEDGYSVSVKTSLAPDEALKLTDQAKADKARRDDLKAQEKADAEMLAEKIKARDVEDAYLRRAEAEQDAWEAARQKERDAAWLLAEKAAMAERHAFMEAAYAEDDALIAAANERMIADDKAAKAAMLAEQKETTERALAEERAFLEEQESILKIGLSHQLAAQEKYEAEMKESYKRMKLAASEQYKGVGPSIAAGSQIEQTHGTAAAKLAMGSDSYLLSQTQDLEKYRKTVAALPAEVEKAGAAHAGMTKIMNEAHSAARGLTGSLGALWLTWGSLVPMVAGAAIGSALAGVVSIGKDVEYQLTFVSALSKGAVVDMQQFGDAVRGNLILPKDAAEGMRALAQNGLNVTDSLKALPDVLRLATVGEMSVSDAALGATGVMNAFNLTVDDLGRIGDVFAKAAAESNTSVQGMVESMKQASTVSDLYHVSLEETAATLEIMAKRNITGTQAGTAFRKMIEEIATPSATAKKSIELLGLQFYDSTTKQLKPYSEILTEIKGRTDKLNEQSKLDLLNNIFGERGAKALNAVLSDFDKYTEAVGVLKTQSQDFAKGVADQLSQSTEGRIKGLMTDFQLATVDAFNTSSGSVNNFVETLRSMVNDPAFKSGLSGLANNAAALTQFLLENGRTIGEVAAAYMVFNGIEGVTTKLMTELYGTTTAAAGAQTMLGTTTTVAAAGMEAEAVAAETAAVATRALSGTMAAVTFGLSAVLAVAVPFVAEWILFTDHTDKLTQALDNNKAALDRQEKSLEEEGKRLDKTNESLKLRLMLMSKGMTFEQAQAEADKRAKIGETKNARAPLEDRLAEAQAAAKRAGDFAKSPQVMRTNNLGAFEAAKSANAAVDEAKRQLDEFDKHVAESSKNALVSADNRLTETQLSLRKQVEEFNKTYDEMAAKDPKFKALNAHVNVGEGESDQAIQADLDAKKKAFEGAKEDLHLPDKSKHSEELAETAGLIAEIKRRETELTAYYSFRQQLETKLFSNGMDNAQIKADTEARLEQQHLNAIQKEIDQATKQIEAEKGKYGGKDGAAERQKLDNVLQGLQAQYEAQAKLVDQKRQLAKLDADNAQLKSDSAFEKTLSGMRASEARGIGDQRTTFGASIKGPESSFNSAFNASMNRDASPVEAQNQKLEQAKAAYDEILSRVQDLRDAGVDIGNQYDKQIDDTKKLVDQESSRAMIMKMQQLSAAQTAGDVAQQLYDRSQTASYGWDKFWSDWSKNAASNAKIVESTLSTTFTGLTNEFANFVTTGKFNFRSLVADILAQAAKALAAKELTALMQLGLTLFGGAAGGYTGAGNTGSGFANAGAGDYSPAGLTAAFGHAGGGQTLRDQMYQVNENEPELYTYGGKQYLMAGSKGGRVVPMDRGYTGNAAGREQATKSTVGGSQNNMNMSVTVMADGSSKVVQDGSGQQASEMGRMINNAVLDILTEEQRPGGRLYALKG